MDVEPVSSCLFQRWWPWIRRLIVGTTMVVFAGSLPFAGAAQAAPKPSPRGAAADRSVQVGAVKTKPVPPAQSDVRWGPPQVSWPEPGSAEVAVAASGRTAVTGQPLRIGRGAGKARPGPSGVVPSAPGRVISRILPRKLAQAANVSGLLIGLRRADVTAAARSDGW